MRWHLTLIAPRTRTDRAPNSSFSRALTRSARVRKLKMTSSGSGIWMSFMRSTSLAHSALASCWARKLRSMIGARASALARRLSAIGRRRILLFVVRLRLDRLLARLDLGGVARDHADDAPAERALDQRRVHLVGQIALGKLREGAGKGSFRRHLRASFPTENATQRLVDIEALDQSGGGRNSGATP